MIVQSNHHCCIIVYQPFTKQLKALGSWLFDTEESLEKQLNKIDWLQYGYDKEIEVSLNQDFSLVPYKFFVNADANRYLELNGIATKERAIQHNEVPLAKAMVLSAESNSDSKSAYAHYLNHLIGKAEPDDSQICVHIDSHHLMATAIKNEQVIGINTFNFDSNDDILYYLLNFTQQLGFNPRKCSYHFSGFLRTKSKLYELLDKYLGELILLNDEYLETKYAPDKPPIPEHFFYLQKVLIQCEL